MKHYHIYWDENNWGSNYPPENWEEICEAANQKINNFLIENGIEDPECITTAQEQDLINFLSQMWADYCAADEIDGVRSKWPDEQT